MGTDNVLTTFDDEFALQQFSGNQSLLEQILVKFVEQNQNFSSELDALLQSADMATAKRKVHTLKGVSGNLGMTALHHQCKDIEATLEAGIPQDLLQAFYATIEQTLSAVSKVDDDSSADSSGNQDFIRALEQSEFLSDEKLDSYVKNSGLNPEQQNKLVGYIDDFNYPRAIELLQS